MNPYTNLIYNRGYLITDHEIEPPHSHWRMLKVNNFMVYFDPSNEVEFQQYNQNWIFLLGNIIDLNFFTDDKKDIAKNLLHHLSSSDNSFFDYIDDLSGRFLILYGDDTSAKIMSDATGMRSIFYSTKQTIIGSHFELIQEYVSAPHSKIVQTEWLSSYTSQYFPGHYTPYEDIYFLTPNTLLEVHTKTIKRFFPREEIHPLPIDEIVDEISTLCDKQLEILTKKYKKLILSITAGIDSKTTLALARKYKHHFDFFTYYKGSTVKSLEVDKIVVNDMVKNLGLEDRFQFFNLEQEMPDEFNDLVKILKKNTFNEHGFELAKFYLDYFSSEDILHIRSNLFEIGRAFYRNKNVPKNFTVESMIRGYSYKAGNDNLVKNAFENFYNVIEMDKIFNYDPYDIFYWEFRMGIWHTQVLLESDIAHDTFILFNSRRILKLLLSTPLHNRLKSTIFYKIIEKNWPILNYWKVNSTEKITDFYDEDFDEIGLSLEKATFSSNALDLNNKQASKTFLYPKRAKFYIDKSAPKKGEYCEVKIPLKVEKNIPQYCMLHIRSPYQNRKHPNRMKYQVSLNGQIILEEDICYWRETNQIQISWTPDSNLYELAIKIIAVKDCEDWNWGKAGTILIEKVTLGKVVDRKVKNIEVIASSPYSEIPFARRNNWLNFFSKKNK